MSVLEIKDLFSRPGAPAYPFLDSSRQLCWLESISDQGGRVALRQARPGASRIVTPEGMQIRSRVHEYGGKCFCIAGDFIFFNNFEDGLVYRQHLHKDQVPTPVLLPVSGNLGYADLFYIDALQAIVAVQEMAGESDAGNLNQLVIFPCFEDAPVIPQVAAKGGDFYAAPVVSRQGDRIAWLQWEHPYMPWDVCGLFCAHLLCEDGQWQLGKAEQVAGGKTASVCQPGFLSSGALLFAMDSEAGKEDVSAQHSTGFWNLYHAADRVIAPLTLDQAEYGEAHWVFGQQRWVQTSDGTVLAIATANEQDQLVEIELETGKKREVGMPCARLSQLSVDDGRAYCVAEYSNKPAEILAISQAAETQTLRALEAWLDPADVSEPERLNYPTRDGAHAYANFYPARQTGDQRSALVVLVHGGPTARADTSLKPLVQYFAQNGFAVLDINHRGSTGHGRSYRQALLEQWGEIDANDIADAIAYVCEHRAVDAFRVFIRGGSAGGYAVLRALTRFPDLFRGGACYYGIGNLITLAEITHKFEARYTDRLIGESYSPETAAQPDSRFRSRSPIFDVKNIRSPLILFQGLDDKVVPPEVSREIVRALEANGIRHEYIEYEGEGHGFRRAETKIDSLEREIRFYQDILAKP